MTPPEFNNRGVSSIYRRRSQNEDRLLWFCWRTKQQQEVFYGSAYGKGDAGSSLDASGGSLEPVVLCLSAAGLSPAAPRVGWPLGSDAARPIASHHPAPPSSTGLAAQRIGRAFTGGGAGPGRHQADRRVVEEPALAGSHADGLPVGQRG